MSTLQMTDQNAPETDKRSTILEDQDAPRVEQHQVVTELNGPKGPEPTRYGDWERKGRCVDF
ncbi:DUF1674 domain-containing protein [Methylomonas methanica]|nr:succinate dehydrogenase assembly factor 4 [Methylomonas methanica]